MTNINFKHSHGLRCEICPRFAVHAGSLTEALQLLKKHYADRHPGLVDIYFPEDFRDEPAVEELRERAARGELDDLLRAVADLVERRAL